MAGGFTKRKCNACVEVVLVVLALLSVQYCSGSAVCYSGDREALLQFKAELVDPFNLLASWNNSSPDCCQWTEQGASSVTCNKHGRVISLVLSGRFYDSHSGYTAPLYRDKTFKGVYAASLGRLKYLETLNFVYVGFDGVDIPATWANLKHLRSLTFTYAAVTGPLSGTTVAGWPLHENVDLSNNGFSGPLPSELCRPTLKSINAGNNNFSGVIPACLGSLPDSSFAGNPNLCGPPLSPCT